MKFWKKFGWFALGMTPTLAVLWWQVMVTVIGMVVYSAYQGMVIAGQGGDASTISYDQIMDGFLTGTPYAIVMFVIYVGYQIIFGLWYWLMFCRKKQTGDWKQVLKPQRIGGIIGCGIALQFAISMALTVILPLFPKIYESYSSVMEGLGNESVLMVLCVCILAPIGEEMIFRGLTFRILKKATPWQVALVIQGVLFGVYHMNLVQGIYAALLGFVLGYVAHRYGSVVPGILLHMAINSFSYVLGYILPASLEEQTGWMIVIGVVSVAAAVGFGYLFLKGAKPTEIVTDTVNEADSQSIPAN